jgi:5'-nucleotidase (lipoprotein e(P4) family)
MKFSISICAFLLATLISCQNEVPTSQNKVDSEALLSQQLTMSVLWFQQSAEMRQAYYQAYQYATMLVDNKIKSNTSDKKLAVVLDIDETVLDNSPSETELIRTGKTFNTEGWDEWIAMEKAQALPGAKTFIEYTISQGVEVFYVSNRTIESLNSTIKNLSDLNFPNADSTHVLLMQDTSDKTERRNKIAENYNIIVFVGDNLTDYSDIFSDRGEDMGKQLVDDNKEELLANFVMLPNPMYGEWEKAIYKNNYKVSFEKKLQMKKEALLGY